MKEKNYNLQAVKKCTLNLFIFCFKLIHISCFKLSTVLCSTVTMSNFKDGANLFLKIFYSVSLCNQCIKNYCLHVLFLIFKINKFNEIWKTGRRLLILAFRGLLI